MSIRPKQKPDPTMRLRCIRCKQMFDVSRKIVDQMGPDLECMECVDMAHIEFMRTTGARLGMKCVSGCKCGRGE